MPDSPSSPVDLSNRLPRAFFERETVDVARELLGSVLVTRKEGVLTAGLIIETEAYGDADDLASHAARLRNGSVTSMWGPAGVAYVYRSYGMHAMFNVVAKPPAQTGAVLIRSVRPIEGIESMRARRGVIDEVRLACGPGNLCQSLGITLADHGADLAESEVLWIAWGESPASVSAGPRVGISRSTDLPWRFFATGSPYVSAYRRGGVILPAEPARH